MVSTWAPVIAPADQASAQAGSWRSRRPRLTRRRACPFGSRHRVANQAAAVWAPSGAHAPEASKAAAAVVEKASRRASSRWRSSIDSASA